LSSLVIISKNLNALLKTLNVTSTISNRLKILYYETNKGGKQWIGGLYSFGVAQLVLDFSWYA